MQLNLFGLIGYTIGRFIFVALILLVGLPVYLCRLAIDWIKNDDLAFAQVIVYVPLVILSILL